MSHQLILRITKVIVISVKISSKYKYLIKIKLCLVNQLNSKIIFKSKHHEV